MLCGRTYIRIHTCIPGVQFDNRASDVNGESGKRLFLLEAPDSTRNQLVNNNIIDIECPTMRAFRFFPKRFHFQCDQRLFDASSVQYSSQVFLLINNIKDGAVFKTDVVPRTCADCVALRLVEHPIIVI